MSVDQDGQKKISGTLTEEVVKATLRSLLSSFCGKVTAEKTKRDIAAVNIFSGNI